MEVGYETNGATMNNITFKNITVIHNFHKAAMSIHNCDDAHITNVKYSNITIEDGQMLGDVREDAENDFLIDMTIAYNIDWTQSGGIRGSIDGVTFENIKVYKLLDTIVSRINGESNDSSIKNVTIKGIEIEGKQMTSKQDLGILENQYVSNVSVSQLSEITGAIKTLPYKLDLTTDEVNKTNHENVIQEGMLIPDFAVAKGDLPYIGENSKIETTNKATHGVGNKTTTPADDGTTDNYSLANHNPELATDGDTSTYWASADWTNQDNEFAALTMDFGSELHTIGVVRILGNMDNDFYYNYSLQVWGRKVNSNGETSDKYIRIQSLKDYQMSPSSGNCIDINIITQKYAGIQLRLYKSDNVSAPKRYEISEVMFFPPSLSFGKAIVDSTTHNDVYNVEKIVDGEATGTSYYESKELPAYIVIDLGDVYNVTTFVLCLPPSLLWDARTQEIEILGSNSTSAYDKNTTQFTTIVEKTPYLFDPLTGNRNIVRLNSSVSVRYIKLVISSNDIKGGYNAQLSEFSVYGE